MCIFCNVYFVRQKLFKHLCFILKYSVLNKLSEYIYLTYQKTLLHTILLFISKIVESLNAVEKIPNIRTPKVGNLVEKHIMMHEY